MTEERGRDWNRLFDLLERLILSLAASGAWSSAEAAMRLARRAYRQWGAESASGPDTPGLPLPRRVHFAFVGDEPTIRELA